VKAKTNLKKSKTEEQTYENKTNRNEIPIFPWLRQSVIQQGSMFRSSYSDLLRHVGPEPVRVGRHKS
jgi:hypothetical protein